MKKLLTLLALITTCLSASADTDESLFDPDKVYTIKHKTADYYVGFHVAEALVDKLPHGESSTIPHRAYLRNYKNDNRFPEEKASIDSIGTKFYIIPVNKSGYENCYTIKFAGSENAYLYTIKDEYAVTVGSAERQLVYIMNIDFDQNKEYPNFYWKIVQENENNQVGYQISPFGQQDKYFKHLPTQENSDFGEGNGYIQIEGGAAVSWTINKYEGEISPISNEKIRILQKKIDDIVYESILHPTVGYPYWNPDDWDPANGEFALLEEETTDMQGTKWINFSVYYETLKKYHEVCAAKNVTLPKNDRTYKIKARFNTSEPDIYTYKYLAYDNEKSDFGQLKTVETETEELATPWIVKVISEEKTGISAALIDANSGKFLYVESAAKYNSSGNKATYSDGNIPTVKISKQSPDHHGGIPSYIDDCTLGCLVIEGVPFDGGEEFALTVNSSGTICDVPSEGNFKYYYEGTPDGEGNYLSSQFVFEEVENPNKVIISNPRQGENATELDGKWIGTFSAPYDVDLSDIQVETVEEKTEKEFFEDCYKTELEEARKGMNEDEYQEFYSNLFNDRWYDYEDSGYYNYIENKEEEGWEAIITGVDVEDIYGVGYNYYSPKYSYRKTTRTKLLDSDEEAYTAELSGSKIFLHKLDPDQKVLPRNTGIIFILTQAKADNYNETHKTNKVTEYAYPYVGEAPTELPTNHLLGSGGFATAMTNSEYVLAAKSPKDESIGVGFYKSKVGDLARNKAYFSLQNGESISAFQYIFDEGEQTTSILSAHQDADNISNTYDLSGRKIEGGQFRGVCIRNGHKVIR